MGAVRQFARAWHGLALALILLALAARLLTPAGFMPVSDAHGARLVPCSGHGPMAMPGHNGSGHDGSDQAPCGFGALAALGLGGADAPLLAAALAFVVAQGRVDPPAPQVARPPRLRPPLRAPPALLS